MLTNHIFGLAINYRFESYRSFLPKMPFSWSSKTYFCVFSANFLIFVFSKNLIINFYTFLTTCKKKLANSFKIWRVILISRKWFQIFRTYNPCYCKKYADISSFWKNSKNDDQVGLTVTTLVSFRQIVYRKKSIRLKMLILLT